MKAKLFCVFCVPIIIFMFFVNVGTASANGCYVIDRNNCVPGLISEDTWYTPQPQHTIGKAVWYAQWLMDATAEWRGMSLEGFKGGVSLFSPADIGEVVWIQRDGFDWEGPFLVVDASQRNHMYTTVSFIQEVVEVDFNTALEWGMVEVTDESTGAYKVLHWMFRDVEVYKGLHPPEDSTPVSYAEFFLDTMVLDDAMHSHWVFDESKIANYDDYQVVMAQDELQKVAVAINSTGDFDLDAPKVSLLKIPEKVAVLGYKLQDRMIISGEATRDIEMEPIVADIEIGYVDAHRYRAAEEVMPVESVFWDVDCQDENPYTGFEMLGTCVPGVITYDSWMLRIPKHTVGVATYYQPGIVDKVLENRGMSLNGYKDAIVTMSCAHIGESAWLRRPGFGWEGPYLIIDCSQPYHSWMNIVDRHLHIEVDQGLWNQWRDTSGTQNIEMCLGGSNCIGNPASFWYYWEERVKFQIPGNTQSILSN